MAPQPWAKPDQREWLEKLLPQFQEAQRSGTTQAFWSTVHRQFFEQWPSSESEVLPDTVEKKPKGKKGQATEPKAPQEYASEESWANHRKKQIINWFNNFKGITKRRTGIASTVINLSGTESRISSEHSIYSRLFYEERIKATVEQALAGLADNDSRRLAIRNKCTAELYKKEDPHIIAIVQAEREQEVKAKERLKQTDVRSETPDQFASALVSLPALCRTFLDDRSKMTGWSFVLLAGGPEPTTEGNIRTLVISNGTDRFGKTFSAANPRFKEDCINPFAAFLHNVYYITIRPLKDEEADTTGSASVQPLAHRPSPAMKSNSPVNKDVASTMPSPHGQITLARAQLPLPAPATTIPRDDKLSPVSQSPPSEPAVQSVDLSAELTATGSTPPSQLPLSLGTAAQLVDMSQDTPTATGSIATAGAQLHFQDPVVLPLATTSLGQQMHSQTPKSSFPTPDPMSVDMSLDKPTATGSSATAEAQLYFQDPVVLPLAMTSQGQHMHSQTPGSSFPTLDPPQSALPKLSNEELKMIAEVFENTEMFENTGNCNAPDKTSTFDSQADDSLALFDPYGLPDFSNVGAIASAGNGQGNGGGWNFDALNADANVPLYHDQNTGMNDNIWENQMMGSDQNAWRGENQGVSLTDYFMDFALLSPPTTSPNHLEQASTRMVNSMTTTAPPLVSAALTPAACDTESIPSSVSNTSLPNGAIPNTEPVEGKKPPAPITDDSKNTPVAVLQNITIPNINIVEGEKPPNADGSENVPVPVLQNAMPNIEGEKLANADGSTNGAVVGQAESGDRSTRIRKPATSKQMPTVWRDAAHTYLALDMDDDAWKACVALWLQFEIEEESTFETTSFRLGAKVRPKIFTKWAANRNYAAVPTIVDKETYAIEWLKWWNSIQPKWRQNSDSEGLPIEATTTKLKDQWQALRKGGPSGLVTLLIGLKWWADIRDEDPRWGLAVADMTTCFRAISSGPKKRKAPPTDDEHEEKRMKVV